MKLNINEQEALLDAVEAVVRSQMEIDKTVSELKKQFGRNNVVGFMRMVRQSGFRDIP